MNNALSNIAVQGNLNMDDVLTVVTSRAERGFNASLSQAKTKVSSLEKTIKAKQNEIATRTTEECMTLVTAKADAARPGIEAMGGTVTAKANGTRGDKIVGTVSVQRPGDSYNGSIDFTFTADKSKVLVAMEQELTDLQESLSVATQEAMGWKKKLASIPTLERQYKAKIAEAKLATSTDGQALLDLLTEDLESNMLALPAN